MDCIKPSREKDSSTTLLIVQHLEMRKSGNILEIICREKSKLRPFLLRQSFHDKMYLGRDEIFQKIWKGDLLKRFNSIFGTWKYVKKFANLQCDALNPIYLIFEIGISVILRKWRLLLFWSKERRCLIEKAV